MKKVIEVIENLIANVINLYT